MPKLNDTQLILLSAAAKRRSGSMMPLPDTIATAGDRTTKAITALVKQGFEPHRDHRRQFGLSYAAMGTSSSMA